MRLGAFLLASCSALIVTQAMAQTTPANNNGNNGNIETVVVTAEKRTEKLKDVPGSITALSSGTLENLNIHDFEDYVGLVPNLDQRSSGVVGQGAVVIRGTNTGPQQTTNTTAFYIDNTPFTANSFLSIGSLLTPDPDLTDVDHIEVLKGPQSTLYGASAIGGIVHIVTKQPDLEDYSGMIRVDGNAIEGGGLGWGVRGMVNIPLIDDELGLRITAFDRHDGGWTQAYNTSNEPFGGKNSNVDTVSGVRAALLWQPTSHLRFNLSGMYQNIYAVGAANESDYELTTTPIFGKYTYQADSLPTFSSRYAVLSLDTTYDNSWGTFTNAASFASYTADIQADLTQTYGYFVGLYGIANGPGNGPSSHCASYPACVPYGFTLPSGEPPTMAKITDELRFASVRFGNFEFLGGLFYTHEDDSYDFDAHIVDPNGMVDPYFGNFYTYLGSFRYQEESAYADLTYYFLDNLDAEVGARYAINQQTVYSRNSGLIAPAPAGIQPTISSNGHSDTFLATLRWRPTEDISTYLRAASGYRPGGPQTNPLVPNQSANVGPDEIWSYEAGIKGSAFDNMLSFDFDVYRMNWTNIQLNGLVGAFVYVANGGTATIQGSELELHFRPTNHLTFGTAIGYNETRLDTINTNVSQYLGATVGAPLPLAPLWNGSVTGDYDFPVADNMTGDVGFTFKFHGPDDTSYPGQFIDPTDPSKDMGDNPDARLPGYSTIDLRSSLSFDNYFVQFTISNLLNTDDTIGYGINNDYPSQGLPAAATIDRPRTYSISFTATF